MKISDIKGAFGQRLIADANNTIYNCIHMFFALEFNFNHKVFYTKINSISKLKKLFSVGLNSKCNINSNAYIEYDVLYIEYSYMKNGKWPFIDLKYPNETIIKSYHTSYRYIICDIDMHFSRLINDHDGQLRCEIYYKIIGNLEHALQYCPQFLKQENEYCYKDANNRKIQLYDDIVWTRNNSLHRSIVIGFEERYIITDDKHKLYVDDNCINGYIMIISNPINFGGIKIN